ncbi:MAG: 2,5-diamino-6-(ribosylamino)-4(3H)-pyrimidinone 5'-phosphate reductase [Candidatus Altiarchaeota archaeon]|nr:2,5-diamino-6-(ribosylamino)-4(3H)-pyrimidinone 5'-phosphate reductase [Candidatus Altiarchaeota archaeon]
MKPFICINSAMSLDGKLSTYERRQVRISNKEDLERVDLLRAGSDAVMVGSNTVAIDDPKLTVKSEALRRQRLEKGLPENPAKVMVGSIKKINPDGDFLSYGNTEKIIFTTEKEEKERIEELEKKARVYVMGKEKANIHEMIDILAGLGINRIMVEGGGTLNYEMIEAGLVDEIYVAVSPMIFGGKDAPTLADGAGLPYRKAVKLELFDTKNLNGVLVLKYRVLK